MCIQKYTSPFDLQQAQVSPDYSAADPEQKSSDEVRPYDDWAVTLHPALDLEAGSQSRTQHSLREDNCDDLQTAQSVKATVLRAARLKFMRDTADYVSAGESMLLVDWAIQLNMFSCYL